MMIYPAIDLMSGQCVRLYRGDFEQKKAYGSHPIEMAKLYKGEGAKWLHLVDLDGARDPKKRQIELITEIIEKSSLKVQTGGGIRSAKDVEGLLNAGASRVVIGSLAIKNRQATKEIFKTFGSDQVCLAADFLLQENEYKVSISGWQEGVKVTLNELIEDYLDAGLKHVLCTDISRDGTMGGCNFDVYTEIQRSFSKIKLQASGGIGSLEDLRKLNTAGVIIGKALYERAFTLKQALEVVSC